MEDRVRAAPSNDAPLACSLTSADLANRRRWLGELAERAVSVRRTGTGMRATFPAEPGLETELREVAAAESECCAFLRITVTPRDAIVELDVAGPSDARPIIDEMFGSRA
jgi:hypothetical protein